MTTEASAMERTQQLVQASYARVARSSLSSDHAGVRSVAEAFGYSSAELDSIPSQANMGLSCGNPAASASLRPGEVVLDLGCGGGLDVFLAAQKVGPTGRVIGVDMTADMLRRGITSARKASINNVSFVQATIDHLPLPEGSVDCVISNCVINLAVDKPAVFREIFRVLRPGGRVAVSDIALKQELPPEVARDVGAYVGCIAGAITIEAFESGLLRAGFSAVHVVDTGADLNAYAGVEGQSGCCSPAMVMPGKPATAGSCCGGPSPQGGDVHQMLSAVIERYNLNEYAASVKVFAIKPG